MTDIKTIAESIVTLTAAGLKVEQAVDLLTKFAPEVAAISYATAELTDFTVETERVGYRIVVLQRGWVVVGDVTKTGSVLVISDARVIRRWGTKDKGLGGLVDGPLAETVLDDAGTVRAHELGVVLMLDVKAEKWAR